MKTRLAQLLLLLLLSLAVSTGHGQDTTSRYRSTLSLYERELVPVPRPGGGLLTYVVSRLGVSPLFVDTSTIYNWGQKFVAERAFLAGRLTDERTYQEGRYRKVSTQINFVTELTNKPTVYPSAIPNIPGLSDSLSRYATKQQVAALQAGGARDSSAYTKLQAEQIFAKTTATQSALDVRTVRATAAQMRSGALAATPPAYYYRADAGRESTYRADPLDTTSPDDNVLCIVTPSGLRYKLVVPDKRLTPQLFGAKADGQTDDGLALLAWITAPASYALDLPAGIYLSSVKLSRTDQGGVSITGAGMGRSVVRFTADTDGISIRNTTDAVRGPIRLTGFTIESAGTKTAGRKALDIQSRYLQRPGPVIDQLGVVGYGTNLEWGTAINLYDCSSTTVQNCDIQGSSYLVTTGIALSNAPGQPAVEHAFTNNNIRQVYRGYSILGTGYPAAEGVQISGGGVVGCRQGLYAVSGGYGAPYIGMDKWHVNSFGGEAVYIDGFQQLTSKGNLFYVGADGSLLPDRGVYLNNTVTMTGDMVVNLLAAIPNAVELAGSGGGFDLAVTGILSGGPSNVIKVAAGYTGVSLAPQRLLANGYTGANTGLDILDLSGKVGRRPTLLYQASPADKGFVNYDASIGAYRVISREVASAVRGQYVSTTTTVDATQYNLWTVGNGGSDIVLVFDTGKLTPGQPLYVKRYDDSSTGAITIQTSNPSGNRIQQKTGALANSFLLPTTTGSRQSAFFWDGATLQLLY